MTEVKRHTVHGYGRQDIYYNEPDGEFVFYEDYAELKAQHDELQEKLDLKQNLTEQIVELKKQRDALAGENANIKTMNDVLSEELRGYESDGAYDGPIAHKLWHSNSDTPATDAYLNYVRADAVEMAVNELKELAQRSKSEAPKAAEHIHASALYLMIIVDQLRAGEQS